MHLHMGTGMLHSQQGGKLRKESRTESVNTPVVTPLPPYCGMPENAAYGYHHCRVLSIDSTSSVQRSYIHIGEISKE